MPCRDITVCIKIRRSFIQNIRQGISIEKPVKAVHGILWKEDYNSSMKAKSNKMNVEHDFSKGSMIRNILSMAVPVTIAQAVQLLYNLVDRVYLGHIGQGADQALTGVGLVFPIISIVSSLLPV